MSLGNREPDSLTATAPQDAAQEGLTRHSSRQSRLNFKQGAVLVAVPIMATGGNTLLAVGMRHIGRIGMGNWRMLFSAILNPYILLGVLLLTGFFSCYLLALSWADLTYVIPTTSFGYILIPIVSHLFLGESISDYRWMGVVLISCGVIVGSRGPIRTGPRLQPDGGK